MERVVLSINKTDKAAISKGKIKLTIKGFYQWLYQSEEYPALVKWIKIDASRGTKLPEELLTEAEAVELVVACKSARDKAVIALLWDTGLRVGELLGLRVKDIVLSQSELSYVMVERKVRRLQSLWRSLRLLLN